MVSQCFLGLQLGIQEQQFPLVEALVGNDTGENTLQPIQCFLFCSGETEGL